MSRDEEEQCIASENSDNPEAPDWDHFEVEDLELDEDMFSMTLVSIVRDVFFMKIKPITITERRLRLLTTLAVHFFTIGLQIFLMMKVKEFVTAKAVHDVRGAYDGFEVKMYANTSLTVNGNHRGIGELIKANFGLLSDDEQSMACRIPLSQPYFFGTILFIWTLVAFTDIKKAILYTQSMVINTKKIEDISELLTHQDFSENAHTLVISHLTNSLKAAIVILVIIPRFIITMVLLWLGCRWLLATTNFGDLIMNAVALEFILLLKDTIYTALIPHRNKLDVQHTRILPYTKVYKSSKRVLLGSFGWAILAFIWVVAYMGIPHVMSGWQTVLPEYKWDVHEVCSAWIEVRFCILPRDQCPTLPPAPVASVTAAPIVAAVAALVANVTA